MIDSMCEVPTKVCGTYFRYCLVYLYICTYTVYINILPESYTCICSHYLINHTVYANTQTFKPFQIHPHIHLTQRNGELWLFSPYYVSVYCRTDAPHMRNDPPIVINTKQGGRR